MFNRPQWLALAEECLQEIIQITVQNTFGIRGLFLRPHILDQFVRMQHIVSDLRAPLDLFLTSLDLCPLLIACLDLQFVKLLEQLDGPFLVLQLGASLCFR